ncbi:hypothetical protein ABEB36_004947 [Hypothenemus hampei]|uniref:Ig-like domain-containing protein n=1 Tax=Hypothenemus hampei TaxID=57062 RepID=A0ABD1EWV1_HYPHA
MHIDFHQATLLTVLHLLFGLVRPIPVSDIDGSDGVLVRTVVGGSTVDLTCNSNDENHNFQYWHLLNKGIIIGPDNNYDKAKFRYRILSGNLTIKAVSTDEEGLYECVSKSLNGQDLKIKMVRMVVLNDWQDVYENDYNINVIRVLIALITLVLLSMGAWFVYRIWKDRYRYPSYLRSGDDDDDDESTEELFSQQPSTSKKVPNNIVPATSSVHTNDVFDDVDISTDFKSILDNSNDN